MGIEALFDGSLEAEAQAPTPETPVEVTPAPEIVEPPVPEPAPEPATPVEPEAAKHVPLATFLDVRDEAKELKRWKTEREARDAAPPPADMPDPVDDPQGFAAWNDTRMEQRLVAERFNISDIMARQTYGEDVVKTAAEWATEKAKAEPGWHQTMMQQPHPLDWIVREHKRNGLMTEIGDNVDDWFTREAAKRGYQPGTLPIAAVAPVAAAQAQPVAAAPTPPRSLVSEPGKGGGVKDVPTGPMAALETVFR